MTTSGVDRSKPENCVTCQCRICLRQNCPCICRKPYGCLSTMINCGDAIAPTPSIGEWVEELWSEHDAVKV